MKPFVMLFVVVALVVSAPGCQKDKRGSASAMVQTTLPENVEVSLLSVERPGTYVERSRTDFSGTVRFVGVVPGRYRMLFQFSMPDITPTANPYNYGESEPFEIRPGKNRLEWTAGRPEVTRADE